MLFSWVFVFQPALIISREVVLLRGGAFSDGGVGPRMAGCRFRGGLLVGQSSEDIFEAVCSEHEGVESLAVGLATEETGA